MYIFTKIGSNYQPAKLLLGMFMLFSIFTFTGFSAATEQDLRQAVKTEVSIAKTVKACKRTISYQSGCRLCRYQALVTGFGQNFGNLRRTYTQLVKVEFDQLEVKQYHIKPPFHFFRLAIPENSDDEPSIAG